MIACGNGGLAPTLAADLITFDSPQTAYSSGAVHTAQPQTRHESVASQWPGQVLAVPDAWCKRAASGVGRGGGSGRWHAVGA